LFALINNAGIATPGPLASIPEDVFSRQFEVNVIGLQRVTRLFWPLLLEHLSQELPPIIVNISSVSGRFTSPFLGTYSASKRAVEGMTDALRREGSLLGLRVVSIQPGPIQSRIWEKAGQSPDYFRNSVFEIFSPLMEKAIRFSTDKALPAGVVAEKVRQAMNLRRPRPRYIIASNAFTLKILKFLPDQWIDRFALRRLRKMVGVDLKKYTKDHL
jgi:NAD(P)-dependent dehydrogenase (short-subunit alcohol dehydrogenase family)